MILKIVGTEEARPIYSKMDKKDPSKYANLIPGRIRHSLVLEHPDGTQVKVQVPSAFFEKCLIRCSSDCI